MAQLRKSNIRTLPYVNGRLFDVGIPQWMELEGANFAALNR
jgi:hypothetical protein